MLPGLLRAGSVSGENVFLGLPSGQHHHHCVWCLVALGRAWCAREGQLLGLQPLMADKCQGRLPTYQWGGGELPRGREGGGKVSECGK